MKEKKEIPNWIKWILAILIAIIVFGIYRSITSDGNEEIQETTDKKESLQKGIDAKYEKQLELESKAKDSAKSYYDKGNTIIKEIYYEKQPIILPAADSVNRYIAAYQFTERK